MLHKLYLSDAIATTTYFFFVLLLYILYYYSTAFLAYEPTVIESHMDGKTKLWHFYR